MTATIASRVVWTVAELSADELAALAFIVEHARRRAGGDPWERQAIAAHLRQLGDLEPIDALTVALRAAGDTAAATPVAITWTQYRYDLDSTRPIKPPICDHCGRSQPQCVRAQRNTHTDQHTFRSRSQTRGAA